MAVKDSIEFAKKYPAGYLATVDGSRPRVRVFMLWRADASGFYFETFKSKQVCDQLHKNPSVEVCFFNNAGDMMQWKTLRIAGKVEFLDDQELKRQLLEDWPFLKGAASGPADPNFMLFRIAHGEAHFWTAADMLKERQVRHESF